MVSFIFYNMVIEKIFICENGIINIRNHVLLEGYRAKIKIIELRAINQNVNIFDVKIND